MNIFNLSLIFPTKGSDTKTKVFYPKKRTFLKSSNYFNKTKMSNNIKVKHGFKRQVYGFTKIRNKNKFH